MADTIKIGNLDISAFKVGSDNCKIYLGDTLLYPQSQPTIKNYLRFIATNSGTFTFTGNDIDYSLDSGATWTTLSNGTATPTITAGSIILWKASGLTPTSSGGIGTFSSTANFTAEGNVMSLLYGDNFEGQTSLAGKDHALRSLFRRCKTLTSIDNMSLPATTLSASCYRAMFSGCTSITSIENLVLPATTLAENCYTRMFYGCTSLTTAPELPATTLAEHCYNSMFYGCTSLTTVPSDLLPATTLAIRCYYSMFYGCTSLTTVPSDLLPATALITACYYNMFYGCTGLTTSPVLPAPTLVQDCYRQMFYNCRNLNKITCLATNISASNCTNNWVANVAANGTFYKAASMSSWTTGNSGIPRSWTVVDYNPYEFKHLTFTALESGTFKFSVNNINYSIDSGKTWNTLSANTNSPTLESGETIMWKASGLTPTSGSGIGRFSSTCNFAAEGNIMSLYYGDNFEGNRSLSGKDYAFAFMFNQTSGLTSIDNMSLPATTLSTQCYRNMFGGTKITSIPTDLLPATTLATQCYMNMFIGCSNLTDVSNLKLPSTTLANTCYQGMFAQCANLERTPTLSAATLVKECYIYMYQSSRKINYIKCLATNISASNCTKNWVSNVASNGTFYKASGMSSWTTGNSGIPSGWTVVDYSG